MSRVCQHCGADISHRRPGIAYCDGGCRQDYHNAAHAARVAAARAAALAANGPVLPPRPCGYCGTEYQPRWPQHRYCSVDCRRWAKDAAREAAQQAVAVAECHASIEATFQRALRRIRASRRYRLTPEVATSQRGDWGAYCNARTPDTAGLSLPELRPRPSRAKGRRAS